MWGIKYSDIRFLCVCNDEGRKYILDKINLYIKHVSFNIFILILIYFLTMIHKKI